MEFSFVSFRFLFRRFLSNMVQLWSFILFRFSFPFPVFCLRCSSLGVSFWFVLVSISQFFVEIALGFEFQFISVSFWFLFLWILSKMVQHGSFLWFCFILVYQLFVEIAPASEFCFVAVSLS